MDSFSVRKSLNSYVKKLLDEWGMFIFVGVVIVGLGAGNIYQGLSHTSTKLEEQIEFINLMNFNQKVMDDNYKLLDLNRRQVIQIQQMDTFIQQMYRRLQQYEPLPDLPGQNKPERSEA